MDFEKSLRKAIEKRDYFESVSCISRICENVLGYKKIGEHSSIGSYEKVVEDLVKSIAPELIKHAVPPEMLYGVKEVVVVCTNQPTIANEECHHFSNSSNKNPEGIVAGLLCERNGNNIRLKDIRPEIPVGFAGYGDKWWDEGELVKTPECFKENIQVPKDISVVSRMKIETFFKKTKA